jgi:quercetin dioxygenase-like cupin family protein
LPQGGVHRARGEGQAYWLLTDLFTFKATGEDTNGAFVIAEHSAGPEGPPPHVHQADEAFYVLEGTWEFSLAGRVFSAGPGDFVLLPKGVVHTHRAAGGGRAKALAIQTPAGVERFIAEAGRPAADRAVPPAMPDMAELGRIVEVAARHGIAVPRG